MILKNGNDITLSHLYKTVEVFYKTVSGSTFLQYIHYAALYIDPIPKFIS